MLATLTHNQWKRRTSYLNKTIRKLICRKLIWFTNCQNARIFSHYLCALSAPLSLGMSLSKLDNCWVYSEVRIIGSKVVAISLTLAVKVDKELMKKRPKLCHRLDLIYTFSWWVNQVWVNLKCWNTSSTLHLVVFTYAVTVRQTQVSLPHSYATNLQMSKR